MQVLQENGLKLSASGSLIPTFAKERAVKGYKCWNRTASVITLIVASVATAATANAGAFAVREQSAYYQGMSFAGSAAGDSLSSMFWNSAAAAAAPGINSESHVAIANPHTQITATDGALLANPLLETESGNIGDPTLIPASYANYQVNDRLYLGIATNSQFGFTTKPDNLNFVGTPIATTSEVFSININPNIAYKVTPELTVGVGAQILYANVRLRSSDPSGLLATPGRTTEVDDWALGATAGVIWKPAPGTSLGLGYRSRIEVDAEGACTGFGLSNVAANPLAPIACGASTDVSADLTLPDLVTASFSQQVTERVTLLGTVEWTNWSLVGEEAKFKNNNGTAIDVFPLGYDDGWFFSAGLEYAYTPDTTFRGGVAYEISPISDEVRNVSLPDADRIWLSVGASTQLTDNISIDLAYTHIFVDDAPISTFASNGALLLKAEAEGDTDIIAASFKYKWGGGEPPLEPLK